MIIDLNVFMTLHRNEISLSALPGTGTLLWKNHALTSAQNESPTKHTWSFEVTGLGLVRTGPKVANCPKIPEVLSVFSTWVLHCRPWPVPVIYSRS